MYMQAQLTLHLPFCRWGDKLEENTKLQDSSCWKVSSHGRY